MRVLVLNAGSSSLKSSVVQQPGDVTGRRNELERAPGGWDETLRSVLADTDGLDAVGYRVVHGGERHVAPLRLSDAALGELDRLRDLAPLHNGPALDVIRAAMAALPDLPHVACFDTAFHATLPEDATTYPLPFPWRAEWGIRRYGFHGLSVAWSVERICQLLGRPIAELDVIVAHLGSGCSVTAVEGGRSVHTSMGMTPLEGLMMATRSGSVDPGLLLGLLDDGRLSLAELAESLQHQSGLLGVSGVSGDMRAVASAAADGDMRARLAIDMFVRHAAAGIAAAASALPRLDALVFTGGIGERAAKVRSAICGRLATLGVPAELMAGDAAADHLLSPAGAAVAVARVAAREDLIMAREVALAVA